ncbi:hypothetical protein [uncultured Clostridium sp.]|uniref:hypothetical protein n=1 Tax=uncultured Clostridium sp. TaxID=59620 RepID=UPI00263232C2|nr:hypothetical protein [uncultured Clostridium sp.]
MCKCKGKCGCNISTTTKGEKGDSSSVSALGYRVYAAFISQIGTSAPTVSILMNTLGEIPTFSYNSVGVYTITSPGGLFPNNKTFVLFGPLEIKNTAKSGAVMFDSGSWNGTNIIFQTYRTDTSVLTNSFLLNTPIEIRVYN